MPEINNDKSIKAIAFYLPQFHTIPENDKAWGKGFTEWVNTKKAKPLFAGHYQPKEPLDKNYYSLLDTDTQLWQANLAKKYGIYGFCYYHYWFKGGKKLLEKPAENMLNNQSIDMPFCFCWANENWSKNWDGGNKEVIVEQDYGTEQDWEMHFQYLLKFFKDDRYITLNNSPILIVYKPELIEDFTKITTYLKKRCKESGFQGCEIMVQYPNYKYSKKYNETNFDHYICFEPAYTVMESNLSSMDATLFTRFKKKVQGILGPNLSHNLSYFLPNKLKDCGLKKYSYDQYWKWILNRTYSHKMIAGAFTDWDNTARNVEGTVFLDGSPEKFNNYLSRLKEKVEKSNVEKLIFINAWNEWAEGAYLEPDEKNKYKYLEALQNALSK